jgi:hypothetical protein
MGIEPSKLGVKTHAITVGNAAENVPGAVCQDYG